MHAFIVTFLHEYIYLVVLGMEPMVLCMVKQVVDLWVRSLAFIVAILTNEDTKAHRC